MNKFIYLILSAFGLFGGIYFSSSIKPDMPARLIIIILTMGVISFVVFLVYLRHYLNIKTN